jgi:selenophosphate synthetase-related protein
LVAAIDLRGRYREPFDNWEAATSAPARRLRGDLDLLPAIAEAGLSVAAKDISQGGLIGTAMMLAECSCVGLDIDIAAIPCPDGVTAERWLRTFPSFGYLLSVAPANVAAVMAAFTERGIAAADIGAVTQGGAVSIGLGGASETVWDFARAPLIGCAHA